MSERDIFAAARAKTDAAARAAFLDEACGSDAVLRKRVERLLRADRDPDSLLDVPGVAAAEPRALDPDALADSTPEEDSDDEALSFLEPPARSDSLGRLGHYEVLEVLGKGGFGIVFRAFDETLQRVVAVKVLAPLMAATSPARRRFLREARSSAQVRHENVVQVHAVEEQPLPYLVMEFIPGETLQQCIDRVGPLDVADVVRISRQVAEGLAAAHATGLIHRDVKPANVLLERGLQGHAKSTDFGLARAADDASLSHSGLVAGTPMYMSPEQARGERIDHRTDLFSLGSVMYLMTSGRPPFRAANTLAVLKRVNEDIPRFIPEIIPETPPWLCDIIAKLQAKKPEERFQSAQEVADLLAHCLPAIQKTSGEARSPEPASPESSEITLPVITPVESQRVQGKAAMPTAVAIGASTGRARQADRSHPGRRWFLALAAVLLLFAGLGLTEATGVTQLRGSIVHLFTAAEMRTVDSESSSGREIPPSAKSNMDPKEKEIDLDRKAAIWALTSGGYARLDVLVDGKEVRVGNGSGKENPSDTSMLPTTPFELRGLNVNRNPKVTDEGLANLKGLRHLTFLQITNNKRVTDATLPYFKDCKNLQVLLLYATAVTDAGLPDLEGFSELKQLSLKQTRVSEAGVNRLAAALPLCRIEWNGKTIEPIANLDPDRRAALWLRSLGPIRLDVIEDNAPGKRMILPDQPLPEGPFRLVTVGFQGPKAEQLGDALAETLAPHLEGVRLTDVYLPHAQSLTTAGLAKLLRLPAFADVTYLNLGNCAVNDGMFAHVARLPNLTNLDASSLPQITGKGIQALQSCRNLKNLTLIDSPLTPEGMAELQQLPALEYLNVSVVPCTEQHIAALTKLKITTLIIASAGINDTMAAQLAALPALERLALSGNPLTDKGLAELRKLGGLKVLEVGATQVTEAGVADLQKALPECKIQRD